ncbi:beta-lactamase transpeptidase-like protein [Coniophora puteana RWD-64-598 SS2]|uniref:Beta-lactamase transpeptidase-like protein n=1 Tax=Coniophora puteana (strain RWD-64-598) TaxID=741705 RepID=A0A5M3MI39_CONPW|nr:beta-lactamase transpeptidase-like protein [Coniophora puteana RWD-64-598 SS2]EIW78707.1 beta-lactamase transpeptidase-like protein [Coniophora puteana RWD-64-598 SS2]
MAPFLHLLGLLGTPFSFLSSLPYRGQSFLSEWANTEFDGGVITPELYAEIDALRKGEGINGLTVGIIRKNGDAEYQSWGRKSEDDDPMTPDTLFHMASVSKAFCVGAVGILMDDYAHNKNVSPLPDGVIEFTWHTKVKDLLPEWGLMDEWAYEKVNLLDILSHVSGLPSHDFSYGPDDTAADVARRMKLLRPIFEPREQYSYNNQMFMLASYLVSKYSDMLYNTFVEERIFAPLNMTSSMYAPSKAQASGLLTQSWTKEGRRIPEWFGDDSVIDLNAGPGGLITNAIDMSKWIQLWLNEGVRANETILPFSTYEKATTAYSVVKGAPADVHHSLIGYGLGWNRLSYLGHDMLSHRGEIPGFSTHVSFLPADGFGVLVFANAAESKAVPKIMDLLIAETLGIRPKEIPSQSPEADTAVLKNDVSGIPEDASIAAPTLDLSALAGTYSDPGYGAFTLCAPESDSSYCTSVHEAFKIVDLASPTNSDSSHNEAPCGLTAAWPRTWSTHVRMSPLGGVDFVIEFTALFPHGYGKDETPFEINEEGMSKGVATFVIGEDGKISGFGVSGLARGLMGRQEGSVQNTAEVWFGRVV